VRRCALAPASGCLPTLHRRYANKNNRSCAKRRAVRAQELHQKTGQSASSNRLRLTISPGKLQPRFAPKWWGCPVVSHSPRIGPDAGTTRCPSLPAVCGY
jgi:hypothetical protein